MVSPVKADDLVQVLLNKVKPGSVTTYAEVSQWAYGVRTRNQPVRSLLRAAVAKGHQTLTNRVVKTSGELASLPEGAGQQLAQLQAEGVPVLSHGAVDFQRTKPVALGTYAPRGAA
jgi:alkylated DNA nucleotide flippase Atl1